MKVFISHASNDNSFVSEVVGLLEQHHVEHWVDFGDIRTGALLTPQLQKAIADHDIFLLVWSAAARRSAWVNTEWLTAFQEGRYIIPCVLDSTPLPACFRNVLFLLGKDLIASPAGFLAMTSSGATGPSEISAPPRPRYSDELIDLLGKIVAQQSDVVESLGRRPLAEIRRLQSKADKLLATALRRWGEQPFVIVLHGYHLKNSYQIAHWDAIQAGQMPADPLLEDAQQRFFDALYLDPNDHRALNGLGNFFLFCNEIEAAEFFTRHAIRLAERCGENCDAYRSDLLLILERLPTVSESAKLEGMVKQGELAMEGFRQQIQTARQADDPVRAEQLTDMLKNLEGVMAQLRAAATAATAAELATALEGARAKISAVDWDRLTTFQDRVHAGEEPAVELARRLLAHAIVVEDLLLMLRLIEPGAGRPEHPKSLASARERE